MVQLSGSSMLDPINDGFHLLISAGVMLTLLSHVATLVSIILLTNITVCQDHILLLLVSPD